MVSRLQVQGFNHRHLIKETMIKRAWTKEGFLCHVKPCYGARELLSELKDAFPAWSPSDYLSRLWTTTEIIPTAEDIDIVFVTESD